VNKIEFNADGFVLLDIAIKPTYSTTMEIITYKVDSGANRTTINSEGLLNSPGGYT
jgi:hypothetical protein